MTLAKDVEPSLGILLLHHIKAAFNAEGRPNMFTSAILKALHDMEEAPWRDLKGGPLNERGLAKRLRDYEVKSKTVRVGMQTAKGYERRDFEDLWRRYPPPSPSESVTSVTSVTTPAAPAAHVTDVTHVTHPSANGGDPSTSRPCAQMRSGRRPTAVP